MCVCSCRVGRSHAMQHGATHAHAQTRRSVNRQTCEIWRGQRGRCEQAQTESPDRKPRPKAQSEAPRGRPRARAKPGDGSTRAESSASAPHLAHSRTRICAAPEFSRHPTASGLQTQFLDTAFRHGLQTRPSDTAFRHGLPKPLAVTDVCSVFVSIQPSPCPPRPADRISPKSSSKSRRRSAAPSR